MLRLRPSLVHADVHEAAAQIEGELHRVVGLVEMADRAIETLMPIENWPGIARAYAARANAHERIGNNEAAGEDRQKQQFYESKDEPEQESPG